MRATRSIIAVVVAFIAALGVTSVGAADLTKTLHVSFPIAETGFDPQPVGDVYSAYVNRVIFDPLYRYDYLARPYKIVPNTATAMPEISPDGKTWIMHVRPGIFFSEDPAFNGKKRELVAADYVYAWKRIIDPRARSNNVSVFDGKLVGADKVVAGAKASGKFDYDAPIEGLQAIDRYTIQVKLNFPTYELQSDLTTSPTAAVAREVIEKYGDDSGWAMANPVGTGPYRLKEWRRTQKIVLEANSGYRDETFPESSKPEDRAIMKEMRGKKIPAIGRIEINIIEESNPRLLAFENRELDFMAVPVDLVRPSGQDEQHGRRSNRADEEKQQIAGRGVRPVKVLDDGDERALERERLEESDEGDVDRLALRGLVREADCGGDRIGDLGRDELLQARAGLLHRELIRM